MSEARPGLRPRDEALAELLGLAAVLPEVETVATFDADGRVLAQDLVSGLHVPPQDNSSMDGYAVRCADLAPLPATLPVTLVMLEAIRDWHDATGDMIGMKPAGGIRTTKDAMKYLVLVNETLGDAWLSPDWFRLGASSLLNDLLLQRQRMSTGRYSGPDYVTVD